MHFESGLINYVVMLAAARPAFAGYKTKFDGIPGYIAGLPGYPRNFSRDVLLAGLISMDAEMLQTQLAISSKHQGKEIDARSGEEPGKIHHEYPGVRLSGREQYLTTYNACDSTALYLLSVEALGHLDPVAYGRFMADGDGAKHVAAAADYIEQHLREGIFWEYPPESSQHYALKTTYWKDSVLPDPAGKQEPDYPATFALAHFQNARGMLSAATVLSDDRLRLVADGMFATGIEEFITANYFETYRDQSSRLQQASSDELQALAYIPPGYRYMMPMRAIRARARQLQTPAGYACTPLAVASRLKDAYHGYVVWPFEQALIHYGCLKFGLRHEAEIAGRCAPHINLGNELLLIESDISGAGNDRQLWSVAAKQYFDGDSALRATDWL